MASYMPNAILGRLLGDNAQISTAVDMEADTIKAMLLTSSHSPDIDAEVFIDDISANEISSSGSYTAGAGSGFSVTPTSSTDDTNDLGAWDASDLSATSFTAADFRYLAFYKWTGAAGTSPILVVIDFATTQSITSGTLTISFASGGIINLATA